MKDFTANGHHTSASVHNLQVEHNTDLHVTVVATNAAGLSAVTYSEPVTVDLTPPLIVSFSVY